MQPKIFDTITNAFERKEELAYFDKLDDYLDHLLPQVRPWGEDLKEREFYVGESWLEVRDDDNFNDIILHVFQENGDYLVSTNGTVKKGKWQLLNENENKMLIEMGVASDLYELAFLDNNYLVLKKHGNQLRLGKKKYFVMGKESEISDLVWREYVEKMFEEYRQGSTTYIVIGIIFLIALGLAIVLSVF